MIRKKLTKASRALMLAGFIVIAVFGVISVAFVSNTPTAYAQTCNYGTDPATGQCIAREPGSQADCPANTVFISGTGGFSRCALKQGAPGSANPQCNWGTDPATNQCIAKEPGSQADCPQNTVFVSGSGGPNSCVKQSNTPGGPATLTCEPDEILRTNQCTSDIDPATGNCKKAGTTKVNVPAGQQAYCVRSANSTAGENANQDEQDNCPIAKNQELRWAYCPLFNGLGLLTNTMDAFINSYLSTGNRIFNNGAGPEEGPDNGYKDAWGTFRNLGISLVVIAGLVMLVSEAFGLEFVDAYTVRRVLPRLLIAIVGIALSWELCKFVVGFFDTLGRAAGSIIYSSFDVGDQGIEIWAVITASWVGIGAGAVGAIAAAPALLGGFGLLSLVGTVVLAALVAVAVLVLRQAIIIACVILAPLAIAAYILPNTNKLADFWWDTFTRMLMLYPIATGIIALCKVMGKIVMSNPGDTAIAQLIATVSGMVFFFAGYALIPFAFRLTGGLVATLGGIANDKSRGGFDRLKNFRKNKMEHNMARMKSGERFQGSQFIPGSGWAAGKMNSATLRAGTKNFGLGAKGRSAYSERRSLLAAQHARSDAGIAGQFNDNLLRAQTYSNESEARRNMGRDFGMSLGEVESAITMAQANGGFGGARQVAAAKALAATGTGYKDIGQMAQTIARVSQGNEGAIEDMVGSMRGAAKQSGRIDLGGAGHGTVSALAKESVDRGYSAPSERSLDKALVEAARSTDNVTIARGKPTSTAQMSAAIGRELDRNMDVINNSTDKNAVRTASVEAAQLTAKINNMKGSKDYGHEIGADAMHHGLAKDGSENKGFANPQVVSHVNAVETRAKPKVADTHPDGTVVTDADGKVVTVPNLEFDPKSPLQDRLREQSSQRGYNPNDPRLN